MPDQTLIEELEMGYLNKMADLALDKNLGDHYRDTANVVSQINALIDTGKLLEEELVAFMQLGYQYYRLKEMLLDAIMREANNP